MPSSSGVRQGSAGAKENQDAPKHEKASQEQPVHPGLEPIIDAKAITIHAVGDTGASSTALIGPEARVSDAMAADLKGERAPAFQRPGCSDPRGPLRPPDDQLTFLDSELARLEPDREELTRSIVLAVHHPPVSFDATHGSSLAMANEIDAVCAKAGVWPDLVLSGHAHLYQRFSRSVAGRSIPSVVVGSGGHLAHAARSDLPPVGADIGNYRMDRRRDLGLGRTGRARQPSRWRSVRRQGRRA